MAITENGGVVFTAFPINLVRYSSRVITGAYTGNQAEDALNYSEQFDLKGMGIYNFIGVNVNGLTYLKGNKVIYDKSKGFLTLKGLKTLDTDRISVVYNKVYENGNAQVALSVPFDINSQIPIVMGDYNTDPKNYKETYDFSTYIIKSFVGVTIDTIFYCHPDVISYNITNKTLTVTGIKMSAGHNVTLIYNTER